MDRVARASFIAGYTNVLTQAWSSEDFGTRLESDPQSILAAEGLATVIGATIKIVRVRDSAPDLDAQIALWERGHMTGEYLLYVPYTPQLLTADLTDEDLADVSGAGESCCCCNPCCCQGE